jgi:hypothetical protein
MKERKDVTMRKLCFVLTALLLTVPAFAGVDVNCVQVGDTNEVAVNYVGSDDANRPRGFGLNITVDSGETITAITSVSSDYWVYPGTIKISDGEIIDEGDPVAPQDSNFPGRELGGLDTNGMTIEMGSLHDPCDEEHPNPPPTSGELLRFRISLGQGEDCNVAIEGNAARGNVVLENTEEAGVSYTGCYVEIPECFPADHPDYDEWVAVGKPSCWCFPRQCHGDADGIKEGGGKVEYHYVGTPDLDILADAWQIAEPKSGGPGLTGNQICADFDHAEHGGGKVEYHRVGTPDLDILAANWQIAEPESGGPGIDPNCLTEY